ncbi:uncharacterized protein [Lepeophtheirus salmonis]|uniref:uncharacterized protein n=1 Tax=Lepeophtheirus salmonis TaxID=72036 RepID=UPI001AE11F3A|nr:uncharacterized protein LOC121120816 [Lepeophtheirus salmonis]
MMAATNFSKPTKFCPLNAANLPQDLDSSGSFVTDSEVKRTTPSSSFSKVPPIFKRIWYFGKTPTHPISSPVEPFEGRDEEEDDSAKGCSSRFYVPSPLSSPRRMRQRLSTKICKSPLLNRVRKKIEERPGASSSSQNGIMSPSSVRFLKSCAFGSSLNSDDEYPNNLHDCGRIANRFYETKWDAWTTMGEDMTEEDEDDDDLDDESSNSYSSSSSMDDFLQLPIDNSYKKGKKSFW